MSIDNFAPGSACTTYQHSFFPYSPCVPAHTRHLDALESISHQKHPSNLMEKREAANGPIVEFRMGFIKVHLTSTVL